MIKRTLIASSILITTIIGCSDESDAPIRANTHAQNTSALPTNRIAIPQAVRSNLGITFATVERRNLKDILRAPGTFEYLPSAQREYRTVLPGRITLHVEQFEHINAGTLLYTIDSPEWRELQQALAGFSANVQQLNAKMEMYSPILLAHEQHEYIVKVNVKLWEERIQKVEELEKTGGGSLRDFTAARAAYAIARAELAEIREKDAELEASYAENIALLRAAKSTLKIALDSAASLLEVPLPQSNPEWWKEITTVEVRASQNGIVASVPMTNGAWAEEHKLVLDVVQPEKLRFHASGLQSDLGVLRDGLQVQIVPPTPTSSGNAVKLQNTMHGILQLGLSGDATDRTIDLYVTPTTLASWARPGVTAQLEITTKATRDAELSIPLAAVQQDGLLPIIFKRALDNPNEAIRIEADLGMNDGRWVAVLSGLTDGDEIVLDGGFQLMLATSGSVQQGGHFHADGTFHEGAH